MEFDLPEELIHRIQYFMSRIDRSIKQTNEERMMRIKQAAQICSTLSKSWSSAWSTRPDLILVHDLHGDDFPTFARETIQRYKNMKMNIHSLDLQMTPLNKFNYETLADELILDTLNLGPLKELSLRISGINNEYGYSLPVQKKYRLPGQVLETTTLTKLSAHNCSFYGAIGTRVCCSRLISLTLGRVTIPEDVLRNLLLICSHSIQKLCLDLLQIEPSIIDLTTMHNLLHLHLCQAAVKFTNAPGGSFSYCNMRTMRLNNVVFDEHNIFTQFSRLFPRLENLSLTDSTGCREEICISSTSLKYLLLDQGYMFKKARLEVPNVRKLALKVRCIPSLSLITCSKSWESHVQWNCSDWHVQDDQELRNLLTELRESKISLHVKIFSVFVDLYGDYLLPPTPVPVVENLKVSGGLLYSRRCNSLLSGLFKICRPRFMTLSKDYTHLFQGDIPMLRKLISSHPHLVHKNDDDDKQRKRPAMQSLYGLKEVKVQLFDKSLKEWSSIEDIIENIRFHFIWRTEPATIK